MNRAGWWLIESAAHALEPDERHVVLGDVAESGEGFGAALIDLLGLVARRQGNLWAAWQPWVALIGIGGVAGAALSRIAFRFHLGLGQQLMAYRKYGVPFETGLTIREDVTFLAVLAIALTVWSWTCGFALGSLSGKTAWFSWLLLTTAILLHGGPGTPFLAPALVGTWLGARKRALTLRSACFAGFLVTAFAILMTWMSGWYETAHEVWSRGVWRGTPWPTRLLPFLVASWPAIYLLAKSYRQHSKEMRLNEK